MLIVRCVVLLQAAAATPLAMHDRDSVLCIKHGLALLPVHFARQQESTGVA
jgi:hypothetical protein